jgi:hypothetical protein
MITRFSQQERRQKNSLGAGSVPITFRRSIEVSGSLDRSAEDDELTDLTPDEREKYRKFWFKFKTLERLQLVSLFILILLPWAFPRLSTRSSGAFDLAVVTILLVSHVWLYCLDCPRCGVKFSGGLLALLPRVNYPWKCYGCDLSRRELKYVSSHMA